MTIFRLAFRVRETHILISETHKLIICECAKYLDIKTR